VTGKVALVAPATMLTLAGTAATAGEPLDKTTSAPPACAGPLRVTVPVVALPPPTVGGASVTEETITDGWRTVKVAFSVTPPKLAEIVNDVVDAT
jgi:hypothetical protein